VCSAEEPSGGCCEPECWVQGKLAIGPWQPLLLSCAAQVVVALFGVRGELASTCSLPPAATGLMPEGQAGAP